MMAPLALAPAFLPSPSHSEWLIGPFPLRAYALTMITGIVVACWIAGRRLEAWGFKAGTIFDIALWGVPFGIVGARLYHVITTPEPYFGPGGDPWKAFAIWQGGLGIWGAIALGAVGGAIGARRAKVPLGVAADAAAPGIAVAQAIGRLGNWFNQELFGAPTTLPWGLQVNPAVAEAAGFPPGTLFHPTFLYELLWDLAVAGVLVWAGRKWVWRHGQTFFAYMALYCLGRVWIEALRIDTANHFLGLRLNVWTSIVVGLAGLGLFIWSRVKHRQDPAEEPPDAEGDGAPAADDAASDPEEGPDGDPAQGADETDEAADDEAGEGPVTVPRVVRDADGDSTEDGTEGLSAAADD